MIRLGLVGYPVQHSLSPLLHEAALQASGLQGEYSLYPVRPDEAGALRGLVDSVRSGELAGLNVTIPHKRVVMRFLDELTPSARAIGAVNTIYLKHGQVLGDNTDCPGFLTELEHFLPRPQSSIVLGAGGAARAVVYALSGTACQVAVAARRVEQARKLAGVSPNVQAMELSTQALQRREADLIVNTTPVGTFPDVDKCAWPTGLPFPEHAAVYDLVYNPRETQLVRVARAEGLKAMSGLGMLVEQAALAFKLWTGHKVERELLLDAIGQTAH
jgi:shikimate dehydrogenase